MTSSETPPSSTLSGVEKTFSDAWALYVDRLWLILTIGGLGAAASMLGVFLPLLGALLLTLLLPSFAQGLPFYFLSWGVSILLSLSVVLWISSWSQVAMMEAVLDPARKPDWKECYRVSWPKVAPFCWVCLLFFIVLVGGTFCFVLPGLFLGVALVFAPVAAVAEGAGGWDAMKRSMELVSGRWQAVALRLFLAGLAASLPGMIPWVGWILASFAAPFSMILAIVVFNDLRRLPARSQPLSVRELQLPLGLAALGLLILGLMSVRTVQMIEDGLPLMRQQYQTMMERPPDPQKVLALLQGGPTVENMSQLYQLMQVSTATAPGTPSP